MSQPLYPPTAPLRAAWLPVGDGHEIHVEEGGNSDGIPVVFLHGGPGSGCKASHRQFFNPVHYRSFLVDQRGAGRSRPFGATAGNTLQALIADLETVRVWAGVERWLLFGGSWGAALALAYAEAHPARVTGMVLRGSFLARARDLAWFLGPDGAARLLPRAWHTFVTALGDVPPEVPAIHRVLFGADHACAESVARAWSQWSTEVVMYAFEHAPQEAPPADAELMGKTRIELHYAQAGYFLRDDQLLDEAHRIPDVPIHLVHGQRDLTCAPEAAWALHRALPGSTLEILRTAGHLSGEAPMQDALLRAADAMVPRLLPGRA